MIKSKNPKFFCENCGSEVPENARVCKACGKFFISVRCPKCGITGASSKFKNGCPECGYAVNSSQKAAFSSGIFAHLKKLKKNYFINNFGKKRNDTSLPFWIYIVTMIIFLGVLWGIYSCLISPSY